MAALRALLEVPGGRMQRLCRIGTVGFDCQHRWKSSSVAAVPLSKAEVPPQWDPLDLSFSDARTAYKSKSTWELIRAYIVLKLSSSNYIVSHHQQLMQVGQRVLGRRLFRLVMRHTFYGHFVGGESADAIQPLVKRLRSFGVKSILDYSAEEDLSEQEAKQVEMAGCISQASSKEELPAGQLKQFQPSEQFADRRHPHVMARTYFYLNEAQCEKNMDTFLKCIDAVADATKGTGLAAIKLTALGRPQLLIQLSEVVVHTRKFFREVTGADKAMALSAVTPSNIEQKVQVSPSERKAFEQWLQRMDFDRNGLMNIFSWSGLVDTNHFISDLFKVPNLQTGRMEPIISALTEEEEEMFRNMMRRVHTIARTAQEKGVRVMVDAEQTYFQPGISRITMELMRKYNREKAIIFNTYQCYLRTTYDHVVRDLELARRQGFFFGAKLVRGAYMEQERLRAKTLGYEDPINATYEDTNATYHKTLTECLRQVAQQKERKTIAIMVASHNEDTVRFAVKQMQELGIQPADKVVCFGQLLGMCDQVSFPLGQAGYSVYKYVPYGPIDEVIPYLSRRAVENHSLLQKVGKELGLLRREIGRRLLTGQLFYKPRGNYTPI
ncbi:proline dehydrogenase 1, mitochondrial [Ixodes scapularis]|uniref:proline dehydrogenase 1, mitochondrial n=1 Tax=Ixodes scapularis TaxID=6945 RepID=UPI0011616780|nr:proline dehydrogenase 1, mitochondrial [Ixodes scapularis]